MIPYQCGAVAGVACRRIDCKSNSCSRPKSFTHIEPLAKGLAAQPVDIPSAPGGAFVELPVARPCLACHGMHLEGGETCGH